MRPTQSVAANLSATIRQDIGIQVLAGTKPISHLALEHEVSRKFVYQQGDKAQRSLDETFAPSQGDGRCSLPFASNQKLAVSANFGVSADLPQFLPWRGGTARRSIRCVNQRRHGS